VTATGQARIGRGQCIEHYGTGEAYLPVLEALGRLCRQADGAGIVTVLAQYAPTWLVQMPALCNAAELDTLQRRVLGATPERMLRELAEALEVLSNAQGLILSLEDLQWSDASTLALLAMLARRHELARLLVLGTYRPVDVLTASHPLLAMQRELQLHAYCQELPLAGLRVTAVASYLEQRFAGGARLPIEELAASLHQRTEGNPLFMSKVADAWVAHGFMMQQQGQ
jgi:hypothetical protein